MRHRAFISNVEPPNNYKQAQRAKFSDEWNKAMQTEWKGLLDNDTFELADRPKDRKIIKVRWVFLTNETTAIELCLTKRV